MPRNAILTIAFDDGYRDTYRYAIPCLDKRDVRCTFAVPAGLIGKSCEKRPVVSREDLRKLVRSGHEIASHTLHHVNFRKRHPASAIVNEIQGSKTRLSTYANTTIDSFVYPYLQSLPFLSLQRAVKKHYVCARYSKYRPVYNVLPIRNQFILQGFCVMSRHSLSDIEKAIDHAIAKYIWLILVFHLVGKHNTKSAHRNAPYRFFTHVDEFKHVINLIRTKNINVMTQREVVRSYGIS